MTDIIKKLNTRNLEIFSTTDSDNRIKVDQQLLREKESVFHEMLEALIFSVELEIRILEEKCFVKILCFNDIDKKVYSKQDYGVECLEDLKRKFKTIEKACHPKSWKEIKELLG